jgi:hypothetical protein
VLSQALMETEVAGLIGAERHERTPDRVTPRNGFACARGTRAWGRSNWRSPSCARAAIFRRCCSRGAAPSQISTAVGTSPAGGA